VIVNATNATALYGVGVEYANIILGEARVKEFNLKRMYRDPNGTLRNMLNATIFREPIICGNVPRLMPHWSQPIVIGRHVHGGIYRATEVKIPGAGKVTLTCPSRWRHFNDARRARFR
jgi:isocitrate dehydrogenase